MSKMVGMPTVLEKKKSNPTSGWVGIKNPPPPHPVVKTLPATSLLNTTHYMTIMLFLFSTEESLIIVPVRRMVELIMVC